MNFPRGSKDSRLMFLIDRLDRIQCATCPVVLERSMHEFTHELLQIKTRPMQHTRFPESAGIFLQCDETMLQDLASRGALLILLGTMRTCLKTNLFYEGKGVNPPLTPQFFNSAAIAVVHFCFPSLERSKIAFQNGGFDIIVDMMHAYRQVEYLQIIGMAALMVLWKGSCESVYSWNIVTDVLAEIVIALETHSENAKLYTVACSALGTLFGPGSIAALSTNEVEFTEDAEAWYYRAVEAICYGIVIHTDDAVALCVGNALLINLVGCREIAEEMISEAEQASLGSPYCAAAA